MKLTPFFKEVIDKRWSEFALAEESQEYTSSEGVVYALVRACQKGKLPAIKEALNRVDGKVAMEIEVEYPKFYMLFPCATSVEGPSSPAGAPPTLALADEDSTSTEEFVPLTNSLRQTLERMGAEPRILVTTILERAKAIDVIASYKGQMPDVEEDPLVKSVIVAGLLKMAHSGGLGAIFEILDQIDGKVAEKIKLLGGDAYLTNYSEVAPAGAIKNKDGVYQIEASNTTNSWAVALERKINSGKSNR